MLCWNQRFVRRHFGEAIAKEKVADGGSSVFTLIMLFSSVFSVGVEWAGARNFATRIW